MFAVLILLAVAFFVGLLAHYVTILDFKIGDGFSEEKKKAREAAYSVTDVKEEHDAVKLLE
ncbi:MAG: hypothetical protein COZ49_01985 [Candidatus Yonathbacteria bacterium CG_4_10_14_3_um_filter_47_65]|uniref:Uncharacterized protein n=2 Tax=Parcubacteria group TaxID=1794811 RepID=A0A2M8D8P3_9BACT|nr:MAG: hypothetical protein AUJ44_00820 [Candidatus Nomurabacteria bacterium CG1_02_47_685]PIP03535.1 MAG: hypothetical protein COX54_03330 [Candidatus Yonathbacteria bacterium CG23_combo_of_CG06-09_8_20_14_all_46_18]PIQ32627.1 MAG: hypothetical protein COW61_01285 [Candidatus Yonathbacteria bacterium CG17_big_fil_post_rev_8_21_14_2_50_46_19]PIX56474.1 MAG: hypothetical protein COZ49_01985 [Candidatus Yonathbacteria bacterium CG_4_10_14_3_um_filter_47_65]PIY57566.1 MAG: hypothetical protein CO